MPFTPAHPAILLPLFRYGHRLSVTGLVMGAIAPDFEYFFRLHPTSTISHTLPGLLVFNLPVALLLATLYQVVVRDALVQQLPLYFRRRALAVARPNWLYYLRSNWLSAILSVLIGAVSHLLWDGFTHYDGIFTEYFPVLLTQVQLGDKTVILCRILQHTSTLVGLLVLLGHIHRSPALQNPPPPDRPVCWVTFWTYVFFLGVSFMICIVPIRLKFYTLPPMIVTLLSGWLLSVVLLSTLRKLQKTGKL